MPTEKEPKFWEGIIMIVQKYGWYIILITMLVIAQAGFNMSSAKPISRKRQFGMGIFSWCLGISIGMICAMINANKYVMAFVGPSVTAIGYATATILFKHVERLIVRIKTVTFFKIVKVDLDNDSEDKKGAA